jgi:sRNA-binding protein
MILIAGKEERLHVRGQLRGFLQSERAQFIAQDVAESDEKLMAEQAEAERAIEAEKAEARRLKELAAEKAAAADAKKVA